MVMIWKPRSIRFWADDFEDWIEEPLKRSRILRLFFSVSEAYLFPIRITNPGAPVFWRLAMLMKAPEMSGLFPEKSSNAPNAPLIVV